MLMDTVTYRFSGHSPSDASSYRTKEELALWQDMDCVKSYGEYLKQHKIIDDDELARIEHHVVDTVTAVTKLAVSLEVSPRVNGEFIETVMFSNQKIDKFDDRQPDVTDSQRRKSETQGSGKEAAFCL